MITVGTKVHHIGQRNAVRARGWAERCVAVGVVFATGNILNTGEPDAMVRWNDGSELAYAQTDLAPAN